MKNLLTRTLSGVVYVAVFVSCILGGSTWFTALMILLVAAGMFEYIKLAQRRLQVSIPSGIYLAVIGVAVWVIGAPWLVTCLRLQPDFWIDPIWGGLLFPGLIFWAVFTHKSDPAGVTSQMLAGLVYVLLPIILLTQVFYILREREAQNLLLVSLIAIWVNDTGAFCVGSLFGKRPLCKRLSPKKSWEGFWGGMIFVIIAMSIYAWVTQRDITLYAMYGALLSAFATVGDLFESMLKRTANVKDSGRLIPGHGGVLDRIDSLLLVSYLIFFMSILINTLYGPFIDDMPLD